LNAFPLEWAMTQMNLGTALEALGVAFMGNVREQNLKGRLLFPMDCSAFLSGRHGQ
jgi:hypothetical protein